MTDDFCGVSGQPGASSPGVDDPDLSRQQVQLRTAGRAGAELWVFGTLRTAFGLDRLDGSWVSGSR
jgi:hypothetical protein